MKLYIAVHDEFPDYMVPTLVAHSMLAAHLQFQDDSIYMKWLLTSFKKVVLRVNQKEFDKIYQLDTEIYVGHENKTMNGDASCIVVLPYEDTQELPNVLKYAKMWKPKQGNI